MSSVARLAKICFQHDSKHRKKNPDLNGMMQLLYNIVFDAIPIITSQGKVITGYAGQGLTLKKKGLKLLMNS